MRVPTIVATTSGDRVVGSSPDDHSIDGDYPMPKTRDDGYGTASYTFTSTPSSGVTEMFTIPIPDNRTPLGFIMVNDDGTEFYTPLTEYYVNYFFDVMLVPPFDSCEIIQKIVAEVDSTRIRVYYEASRVFGGGYPSPPAYMTMTNLKYNFKYVVFVEGKDDADVNTVFATT